MRSSRRCRLPVPLVVDADALNLLGVHAELQEICSVARPLPRY